VQDAIYDADEYLRSELADKGDDPAAFDAAIEAYGTPEEVASAYRETEHTVATALRAPRPKAQRSDNPLARFFGVVADPQAWGALFYLLLALASGVAYFTIVITGVSLTLGTLILIIGIPMALLTLAIVRAISLAEGRIVEGLLGVRMPRRPRTVVGAEGDIWTRIKSWLTDWRTWTTMLYMVLQLPLGIVYFTVVVTAVALSSALIALPLVQAVANAPVIRMGSYGYLIEPWAFPLFVAAGLLGYVITLWVAKGIGYLHGQYAKAMLVGRTAVEGGEL
jgi:tryptophan-rich sensory protein